ncbi:MAG: peptide deformylase [Pseudomonadota bacterium]
MSVLPILAYPDPRLRKKAKPIEVFDAALSSLIDDLFETMYDDNGVGLAATQVNIHLRVVTVDPMENEGRQPFYLINPEIIARDGSIDSPEGCLSVPGAYDKVKRSQRVKVRAQDKEGQFFEKDFADFHAVIVQHEIDHLNGVLFIDHLSSIKRERVRKHLLELSKEKKS